MPDTLTPERLAEIRERHPQSAWQDRDDLLAHLDAITAAVETLDTPGGNWVSRSAVLAILNGEPSDTVAFTVTTLGDREYRPSA